MADDLKQLLLPDERELLSSYGFDKFDMLLQRLAESRAEVRRLREQLQRKETT